MTATTPRETPQARATNQQPEGAFGAASSIRQNSPDTSSAELQTGISNAIPKKEVAATNVPSVKVHAPRTDDTMMSPFNRELADVLRDIMAGTYLLILFLMLLFAGYRIWLWSQNPRRKRRQ